MADANCIRHRKQRPLLDLCGGGSLGIVTSTTIHLFPVSQVCAIYLFYPVDEAQDVFGCYRTWIADAPDGLTLSVLIMNFPPIPYLLEFLRGQSFALVRGCYSVAPSPMGKYSCVIGASGSCR
ncbi:MAG: hypothetical protein H6667_09185 [Ardenticatenaceae bacterium]|nr:hypothetical protein [Ardenticatenaceae bacterium]